MPSASWSSSLPTACLRDHLPPRPILMFRVPARNSSPFVPVILPSRASCCSPAAPLCTVQRADFCAGSDPWQGHPDRLTTLAGRLSTYSEYAHWDGGPTGGGVAALKGFSCRAAPGGLGAITPKRQSWQVAKPRLPGALNRGVVLVSRQCPVMTYRPSSEEWIVSQLVYVVRCRNR